MAALHEPELPPGCSGVGNKSERGHLLALPSEVDTRPSTQARTLDRAARPVGRERGEQVNNEHVLIGGLVRDLYQRVLSAEVATRKSAMTSKMEILSRTHKERSREAEVGVDLENGVRPARVQAEQVRSEVALEGVLPCNAGRQHQLHQSGPFVAPTESSW